MFEIDRCFAPLLFSPRIRSLASLKNLGSKAEGLFDKKKKEAQDLANEKVQAASSLAEDQAKKTQEVFTKTKSDAEALASSTASEIDATKQQATAAAETGAQVSPKEGALRAQQQRSFSNQILDSLDTQAAGTLMDHAKQAAENAIQQSAVVVEKAIEEQMKAAEEKVDEGMKHVSGEVDRKLQEANQLAEQKRGELEQVRPIGDHILDRLTNLLVCASDVGVLQKVTEVTTKAQDTAASGAAGLLGKLNLGK